MSTLLPLLAQIVHVGLMLIAAPTIAGAADWLAARFAGQGGPPILQPWRDLRRLSRKTPVLHENASAVLEYAPLIGLSATLSAAALVPSFTLGMTLSPLSDVLVIVSLLTVARIALLCAALDSGAAMPGLAARQDSALAVLAEPALMLTVFTLALMAGSLHLDSIVIQQRQALLQPAAASAVALTALVAIIFVDACASRSAIDEMLGGTDLALSRMSVWLRRLIWIDLAGGLFLPLGLATTDSGPFDWFIGLVCWAVKLSAFTVGLSAVQTFVGCVARHSMPDLLGAAALLALLAAIMVLSSAGAA